jgi:hypothetical protein
MMSPSTTTTTTKKSVTFDKVTLLEFPMELGDNPCCSRGIPVQLGWKAQAVSIHDIETFDMLRQPKKRSSRKKLIMSIEKRTKIVLNAGYSLNAIAEAALEVEAIRASRRACLKTQGWERMVTMLENTGRVPVDVMKGILSSTGGIIASTTGGLLGSTGRSLRKLKQKTVPARSA